MLSIPNDLRVATEYDFTNDKGKLVPGIKFWVHTYHSNELEEHETFRGMDLNRWKPWMDDARVYVKKIILKPPTTTNIDFL